jgi:hypothetical protein
MVDFQALAGPFDPAEVSWRVGSSNKKKRQRETGDNNAKATKGQALAYLDARNVMDRLDAVCGPAGWQCRYSHATGKTVCDIGVKVENEWVWKADGAGGSDIEAEKGALSDSFKRAAVRWGIGRYLYDVESPWVDLDEWEKIKPAEMDRLGRLLSKAVKSAPEPPPLSGGALMAMDMLRTSRTADELTEIWNTNRPGLKERLDPHEYQAVVAVMHEEAARLKPKAA